MEKGLHELTVNDNLKDAILPLQGIEPELLTHSLLKEGCRDALVVLDGTIVDGHNCYRICHGYGCRCFTRSTLSFIKLQLHYRDYNRFLYLQPLPVILKREFTGADPFQLFIGFGLPTDVIRL